MAIQFEVGDDDRTLRVTDTAEREQFDLRADRAIDAAPAAVKRRLKQRIDCSLDDVR